jgi:integrase
VGNDGTVALNRQVRKQTEMQAQSQGIEIASEDSNPNLTPLLEAISGYLEEIRLSKKPKTLSAYTTALNYFKESCTKEYVEEIDRRDMLRFSAFLRDEKDQGDRSTYNKFESIMTFLKTVGRSKFVNKNDWPVYTEEEVDTYTESDLDKLYKVCLPEERLWWEFFLKTGWREQEVIYAACRNVHLDQGVIEMRRNLDWNWKPKGYKERVVPLPNSLSAALRPVIANRPGSALIFPTESGKPKMDFLHRLKACVRRAGLDEGEFYLHKFRATYATKSLRSGVDIRTVQEWLGHKDIESTMRYLQPARGEEAKEFMKKVFD